MKYLYLAVVSALLSGCLTTPPKREVVQVPVPVPCVPVETAGPPAISTKEVLVKMDDYDMVLTIGKERLELATWSKLIQPILEGCKEIPAPVKAASSP